ncbi:MAG: twin transmembrane helix small protein [Gammaproteobacteria bacterium]|nr:twin transmembrane helix small protein [Gammaproteobacteria bacterium]
MDLMLKIPVVLVLVIIVFSLFEGMYYLAKDDGSRDKTRVVRALTVRIVLSFVLFSILMAAYLMGWIEPNTVA